MNIQEYKKVSDMTYNEYCDYLQNKYGIGLTNYMTQSFNKNKKVTRTSEGLIAHHKMEDRMILLSEPYFAKKCPYEWQEKQNIVYCDYLEHLLLHILICIYPYDTDEYALPVGVGGVLEHIIPELNDVYCGWITKQKWRLNCHKKIINDKEVYLEILKKFFRFIKKKRKDFSVSSVCTSYNSCYGIWNAEKNEGLYKEIIKLYNGLPNK